MAVFKWKNQRPKGYSDDLGDFSHIGLVVSVSPLQIIHSSSVAGKVIIDTRIKNWAYWGYLKDVEYSTKETEKGEEKTMTAIVFSENGKPVKMRARPSTASGVYWEVPINTEVTVLEAGDTWTRIKTGGHEGYMMSKFLTSNDDGTVEADKKIIVSQSELEDAYTILGNCLKQFIVSKADVEKAYDILGDMLGLRG